MTSSRFQVCQCQQKDCQLRFPAIEGTHSGEACPRCGSRTIAVHRPYTAHGVQTRQKKPEGPEVEALLDNVRSVFNVGNMMRTADGVGIRHMHLCGITPTPDNPRMGKTALGAESTVPWTRYRNGLAAATSLKRQGLRLWALEGGSRSEVLFQTSSDIRGSPIVLIVGSEISGIDPEILEQCERVLSLPMQGLKTTLNVAVAFGIAVYFLRYGLRKEPDKVIDRWQ